MRVLVRALLKGAGVSPSGLHQTSPWKEGVRCFFFSLFFTLKDADSLPSFYQLFKQEDSGRGSLLSAHTLSPTVILQHRFVCSLRGRLTDPPQLLGHHGV